MGSSALENTRYTFLQRIHPRSLPQRTTFALQRGVMAVAQRQVIWIMAMGVVAILLGWASGVAMLAEGLVLIGAVALTGFIGVNVLSPARGEALYGPIRPPIELKLLPEDIEAAGVRLAYEAVLNAHAKIRSSLCKREGTMDVLLDSYYRCRELVLLAGRVATVANVLYAYLQQHDVTSLADEVRRLRHRAAQTSDPLARQAYNQSAEARLQQLYTVEEFRGLLDRIQARLELIAASLESVEAFTVKLHARLLGQAAFEDGSGGLDVLREDLEILEAAMQDALLGADDEEFVITAATIVEESFAPSRA